VEALLRQDRRIDTVLLGCTHYALIETTIRRVIPQEIQVVSQGRIVSDKLSDYLRRHPEMERRLDKSGTEAFLTTEYSSRIQRLGAQFFGARIPMETITMG
jgi:glutamate racemase